MKYLVYTVMLLFSFTLVGQENCINGIDDDGDGLIDINDPDCICCRIKYDDYIKNGKFENYLCCAINVECFAHWQQAQASTDVWHPCLGSIPVIVPMPLPADGIAGSRSHATEPEGFYQCLDDCIMADIPYVLSFQYYSSDLITSMPAGFGEGGIEVYGVPKCDDLYSLDFTCPISGDFDLIHQQILPIVPIFAWSQEFVSFTPTRSYEAIVFISGCEGSQKYNYITDISITTNATPTSLEASDPIYTGTPCLGMEFEIVNIQPGVTIQWYIDGVAVVGEDQLTFNLPSFTYGEVSYGIFSARTCDYSDPVQVDPLPDIELNPIIKDVKCFEEMDGSIIIYPSMGQPIYKYLWSTGSMTNSISNLGPGNYTVTVTDGNGCTASDEYTITEPDELTGSILSTTDVDPIIGFGTATALGDGGTPGYTYDWSSGEFGFAAVNLEAGFNYVTITDENDCEVVLEVELFNAPLTFDMTSSITKICKNSCAGLINIDPTGGLPPYTIEWELDTLDGFEIDSLCPGDYNFIIYDSDISSLEGEITITTFEDLEYGINLANPTCKDSLAGSIEVTITKGKSPFQYQWSTGDKVNLIDTLPSGNYQLTITDGNTCQTDTTFDLFNEFFLDPLVMVTPTVCYDDSTGTVDIQLTNSTNYSILWADGNTNFYRDYLPASTLSYTIIEDTSGCEFKSQVVIPSPPRITYNAIDVDTICAGNNNGTLSIDTTGFASKKINYQWDDQSSGPIRSGLSPGNYMLEVTDSAGCVQSQDFLVLEHSISSYNVNAQDPDCDSGNNGFISISSINNKIASVFWNNGMTEDSIYNLIPGNYIASITDVNNCEYIDTITLDDVIPVELTFDVIDEKCIGDSNGSVAIIPENGNIVSSVWSNNETNLTNSNLSPGIYEVVITDEYECMTIHDFEILPGNEILYTINSLDEKCAGESDGRITISTTDNYNYEWNNTPDNTQINDFLEPGIYYVEITDSLDCNALDTVEILSGIEVTIDTEIDSINCEGEFATISIEVTNPVGNYDFLWNNGTTDSILANVNEGIYTVKVEDENGCVARDTFEIDSGFTFNYAIKGKDIICPMSMDGEIVIESTELYDYQWSSGSTSDRIENLPSGTYEVTISDKIGICEIEEVFTIEEFPLQDYELVVQDVKCYGGTDGQFNIIQNGVSIADKIILDGKATSIDTILGAGNYMVTFSDQNTCPRDTFLTIQEPTQLIANISSEQISCFDINDGIASVDVNGGVGDYQYSWSNGETTSLIQGLSKGTYEVTMTDANDCSIVKNIVLKPFELLDAEAVSTNVSCSDPESGEISLEIHNGFSPKFYLNDNGPFETLYFDQLEIGDYTISYEYSPSCIQNIFELSISQSQPEFDVEIDGIPSNFYGFSEIGSIHVNFQNPEFISSSAIWVNGEEICLSDLPDLCVEVEHLFLQENTIIATAIDENFCERSDTLIYKAIRTNDPLHIPNVFSPNGDGANDDWLVNVPPFYIIENALIYDRWGNKIFSSNDPKSLSWDGNFNGKVLQPGVFIYIIDVIDEYDGRQIKLTGDITIVR